MDAVKDCDRIGLAEKGSLTLSLWRLPEAFLGGEEGNQAPAKRRRMPKEAGFYELGMKKLDILSK